ncbi:MAG: recombinase family protein, partial [bacterium]
MQDTKNVFSCAIYTRVSTDSQAEIEFNSCEAQEQKIMSFIKSQDNFRFYKAYSDQGYSGATLDRPALKDILSDIKSGKINIVLAYKIDRLTRSPKDFYQLIEFFDQYNASFISVTERFDTSTPSGRLLRNIMLTFAQFERELTAERTKDKLLQKAINGFPHGGPTTFGYRRNNKNYEIDPEQAKIVRFMYDTYIETKSLHATLKILKEKKYFNRKSKAFTNSTVFNLLRNPVLTGKVTHNNKIYQAQYPAIISDELFNHVQLIHKNLEKFNEIKKELAFASIIKCAECKSTMTSTYTDKKTPTGHKKYYYYRCTKAMKQGFVSCSTCDISATRLENTITENLKRIAIDSDYLSNLVISTKFQNQAPKCLGFEPDTKFDDLTPEKLQNSLKSFIKEFARRKGFDKSLAVRTFIKQIVYSKDKISLEWYYNRIADDILKEFDS